RRLARQPAALFWSDDPRVVPRPARRDARPRPPDRAVRGIAARRPVVGRAARLHGGGPRSAWWFRRRPGRDGHLGDLVADTADRRGLGAGPGPLRAGVPDGPAPAVA